MLEAIATVILGVIAAWIADWLSGWRVRAWLSTVLKRQLRRIGLGKEGPRLILFVSSGETCRDPMAKASRKG